MNLSIRGYHKILKVARTIADIDEIRLKYRYLDLRREEMQSRFKTKSKLLSVVRNYYNSNSNIAMQIA